MASTFTGTSTLQDAFKSIEEFHDSRTKLLEVNAFTSDFSNLDVELQKKLVSYIEGEEVSNTRLVQACLIGFDWSEYECLSDERRAKFIEEFEIRYRAWAAAIKSSLDSKLKDFKHKYLRFEFFMLPFR